MPASVSRRKRAVSRSSARRKVSLSNDEAEGSVLVTPCPDGGTESPMEGAADEDTARLQSCRYGLRSGARRTTTKRTTDKLKSSLVRKRAKKFKGDATEACAEADETVKCLEREFLSLEESEGIVFVRVNVVCTA